jgi:hypothetical protein
MSTCNPLDLESLGSWSTKPKNFPGTNLEWRGSFHKAIMIINSSKTQTWAFQFAKFSLFLRIRIFNSIYFTHCPSTRLTGTSFCQVLNKYLGDFANSIGICKSLIEWNLELFACFQNFKHYLKMLKSSTWWTCTSIP